MRWWCRYRVILSDHLPLPSCIASWDQSELCCQKECENDANLHFLDLTLLCTVPKGAVVAASRTDPRLWDYPDLAVWTAQGPSLVHSTHSTHSSAPCAELMLTFSRRVCRGMPSVWTNHANTQPLPGPETLFIALYCFAFHCTFVHSASSHNTFLRSSSKVKHLFLVSHSHTISPTSTYLLVGCVWSISF